MAAESRRVLCSNRRALRDYSVESRVEAGVELFGTEVKSLRQGGASLAGAFVRVDGGEAWLSGLNIPPYDFGNRFNRASDRLRRLLLHKREICQLQVFSEQKGNALIPLSVYLRRGKVKVEVGICRGQRQSDKRETLKRRTAEREAERAMARYRH